VTKLATELNNVTVIVRSVGERTEEICRSLILQQQVPEEAVFVINEKPFSHAMRVSFQLGLEQGRPWTLCVDADVLLRPGAIGHLMNIANQQPGNVCEIQGYILDKFFGGPRMAGNHLYRTSLLPKVIELIPEEGVNIRPETHTLNAMKIAGYPWKKTQTLVGLHDFEQDYPDIFRKCFIQAHKHAHLTELFISVWRKTASEDKDFQLALKGFSSGIQYYENVYIDVNDPVFEKMFSRTGFSSKEPLSPHEWDLNRIEEIVTQWSDAEGYSNQYPTRGGLGPSFSNQFFFGRALDKPSSTKLFLLGWLIESLGRRLKRIAP